jgi:deoxyribodipyrimidine photolyase-related protein
MGMMYRNWDRQKPERRAALLARANDLLDHLDTI